MIETEVLRAGAAESENAAAARQAIQRACFIGIMGNGSSVECGLSIVPLNSVAELCPPFDSGKIPVFSGKVRDR